jgi:hypothetical protein
MSCLSRVHDAPSDTIPKPWTDPDRVLSAASTMPGDGSEVRVHHGAKSEQSGNPGLNVVEVPGEKLSFKEEAIGALYGFGHDHQRARLTAAVGIRPREGT